MCVLSHKPIAMRRTMKITSDIACSHAKTDKGQEEFAVAGMPGLALRVSNDGRRVWTLRYRTAHRQQRRMTLGTYPSTTLKAARERTRELLADVARGGDPSRVKREQRDDATFEDLFNFWFEDHAKPKLARPHDEKHRYGLHLQKALGSIVAKTLTRHEVKAVFKRITMQAGPVQANRSLELVIRVLNHAVDEELLAVNPVPRLAKNIEKPRERVLSDDELVLFWRELERMESWRPEPGTGARGKPLSRSLIRAIRILILTGQRRGEVISAELPELRLAGEPVWELPGSKTKNELLHRVPLTPMAAFEFRRAVAEANGSQFAFLGADGPIKPASVSTAFMKLCKRVGIEGASAHDIRRTVGTGMARLKVPPHVRSLVLNHAKKPSDMTTFVYDQYGYDDEKREALTAWEGHLRKLFGLTADNVATLG
jgi:integrase